MSANRIPTLLIKDQASLWPCVSVEGWEQKQLSVVTEQLTPTLLYLSVPRLTTVRDRRANLNQTALIQAFYPLASPSRSMPPSMQTYRDIPAEDADKFPLRQYVDEASSDDEDLDSLKGGGEHKARKSRAAPADGGPQAKRGSRRPWQQLCCGLQFSNTCLVIAFLFGVSIVIFLGGGGLYIYKAVPKDGQSPPWYPTPLGGTVESWQKSYDKAKQMVERMTLVEKVNITTGTG
jgi:hypothetical protein